MNSLLQSMIMAVACSGLRVDLNREIPFNLRRDNNDALESANRKIQLAREQNKKNKLARAANKV